MAVPLRNTPRLSREERRQIVALYEAGESCAELGRRFGSSGQTIRAVLRRAGVTSRFVVRSAFYEPTPEEIEAAKIEIHRQRAEQAAARGYVRRGGIYAQRDDKEYTIPEVRIVRLTQPLVR